MIAINPRIPGIRIPHLFFFSRLPAIAPASCAGIFFSTIIDGSGREKSKQIDEKRVSNCHTFLCSRPLQPFGPQGAESIPSFRAEAFPLQRFWKPHSRKDGG